MKKRTLALFLAVWMTIGMLAGCGSNSAKTPDSTPGNTNTPAVSDGQSGQEPAKEAPMLADQVGGRCAARSGGAPSRRGGHLCGDPVQPRGDPAYGGTLRTQNGGIWYYGPIAEEPLFRLLDDGTVEGNVAKSYDVSDDGLVYTIHLRDGMKWSDGTPFTAADCVYYYNYVLSPRWTTRPARS